MEWTSYSNKVWPKFPSYFGEDGFIRFNSWGFHFLFTKTETFLSANDWWTKYPWRLIFLLHTSSSKIEPFFPIRLLFFQIFVFIFVFVCHDIMKSNVTGGHVGSLLYTCQGHFQSQNTSTWSQFRHQGKQKPYLSQHKKCTFVLLAKDCLVHIRQICAKHLILA